MPVEELEDPGSKKQLPRKTSRVKLKVEGRENLPLGVGKRSAVKKLFSEMPGSFVGTNMVGPKAKLGPS